MDLEEVMIAYFEGKSRRAAFALCRSPTRILTHETSAELKEKVRSGCVRQWDLILCLLPNA